MKLGSLLARAMSSPPPRPAAASAIAMHSNSTGGTPRLPHPRVSSLSSQPRPASAQELSRRGSPGPPVAKTSPSQESPLAMPIDNSVQLTRAAPGVVKTRPGSVLSRGFILKTDFHKALETLDVPLHGAPNFRASKLGKLNIYGAAQPRLVGLKAILSVLRCRPGGQGTGRCVWFSTREEPVVYISGRPFVLRDSADPRNSVELSDRAESLEAIELRLKNDVLAEAARFGGLILTHNENAEGDGSIVPMWTAVEENTVRTPREIWDDLRQQGWKVDYHRIPISPSRRIEDNYLDQYVRVIQDLDPLTTSLVFSCGAGAVRTTYAMSAASLLRRKQLMLRGLEDPFAAESLQPRSGTSTPPVVQAAVALEQVTAQQEFSRSLLRLAAILQNTFSTTGAQSAQSAIELLLSQPVLMDNLRKALLGNYGVILSLLGCIDDGLQSKRLVDYVFDSVDHVVNLREIILSHRINYSLAAADGGEGQEIIDRAAQALEKYFFMIAFASYLDSQPTFNETFSQWMQTRVEIWNQVLFLRKSSGSRLNMFAPVNDLSSISKTGAENQIWGPRNANLSGGTTMGDEWTAHVLNNRSGIVLRANTLLKSDQWLSQSHETPLNVRGVINFRNIPDSKIYCLGQPTLEAIDEVVRSIKEKHPDVKRIAWITLREEPLVYINGSPYCLRRESFTLRNMKDYGGISGPRLEILEERLKSDVLAEVQSFGGRVLLHSERAHGEIVPVWEAVKPEDVEVLKEVMARRKSRNGVELIFSRIPITAERAPDPVDISELLELVMRIDSENTPIVLNCQLGRGRSTMASIIVLLAQQWLHSSRQMPPTPGRPHFTRQQTAWPTEPANPQQRSYQSINNLLRVIRNSPAVKSSVDKAIDACSQLYNLREGIEDARVRSEAASDEKERRVQQHRGIHNLRRYFQLVEFQAYLQANQPGILNEHQTFETFLKNHPVFATFEQEMLAAGPAALKPLERVHVTDGVAFPEEVKGIVANRSGTILSASTILKSDFFSGLQKMSLPERIEGAPNFRRVDLSLSYVAGDAHKVCGCGMPTVDGLRRALARVNAGPNGNNTVYWTSLREEPVLYVAGRPHVLRLVDKPLTNVEQKGITTAMIETMESNLKRDLINELRRDAGGRVLVHDEIEDPPANFTITALWETIKEEEIMTPRDVFELMRSEGYRVNYGRVAITDEQAPLPDALSAIFERVKTGLKEAGDLIFNCQMGRGRTTSGMVVASLVSTITQLPKDWDPAEPEEADADAADPYDLIDGYSEEQAYLQGEYKTILQLVGVLSHGKLAKRLTDTAIDAMQDVQNLRKAIYDYKLKAEACAPGSAKHKSVSEVGINYLYRYGTFVAFANYLLERETRAFADWLAEHREIARILERSSFE